MATREKFKSPRIYSESGDVVSWFEVVTLDRARELLSMNKNNRRVKERIVKKYARDMKNGKWYLNGNLICIGKDNTLLDGQHRLMAQLEAGVEIEYQFLGNLNNNRVQKIIDTGTSRTNSDVLQMLGFENCTLLATTARKMLCKESNVNAKNAAFSMDEIIEELKKPEREYLYNFTAKFSRAIYKRYKSLPKSTLALAFVKLMLLNHPEDKIMDFFDQLSDVKPSCGTVRNLRIRIAKRDGRSVSLEEKEFYLIKAWNEFAKGNLDYDVSKIRWQKSCEINFI